MADTADITIAPAGQTILSAADLNTSVNHEARVLDIRAAEVLGYERPADIRPLIDRHSEALERLGGIIRTVRKNGMRGRPSVEVWLNKRQLLFICTKAQTDRATDATIQMVEVFDEYLRGTLPAAKAVVVRGHTRAAPRRAAPQPAVRENQAIMRIAGEIVLVDLTRIELGPEERAVCIDGHGAMSVETVIMRQDQMNPRIGVARVPRAAGQGLSRRGVQVIGAVIGTLPLPNEGSNSTAKRLSGPKRALRRTLPVPPGLERTALPGPSRADALRLH